MNSGIVTSVNSKTPDSNGNVSVTASVSRDEIKSAVLDIFFPVGSIYMDATGNVNPNTQFGGSWSKIENRFLYGSGTKGIGATGGAETHTLNIEQIPSHNHARGGMDMNGYAPANDFSLESKFTGVFKETNIGTTKGGGKSGSENAWTSLYFHAAANWWGESASRGGGQAFNKMPPYLVVSIWKRTA